MANCPKCATELSPGADQCQVCGSYVREVNANAAIRTSKRARLVEWGMLMVGAAAIALILRIVAPNEIRISLWLAEVPLSILVLPVYAAGAIGVILIVVGYASRLLQR